MSTNSTNARGPRPLKILWKWMAVAAVLHLLFVGMLCGISYLGYQKKLAAIETRDAAKEAETQKMEAERKAKLAETAKPEPAPAPVVEPTPPPIKAEQVLGIDKVATPQETPSSPFSSGDDDLLKGLK